MTIRYGNRNASTMNRLTGLCLTTSVTTDSFVSITPKTAPTSAPRNEWYMQQFLFLQVRGFHWRRQDVDAEGGRYVVQSTVKSFYFQRTLTRKSLLKLQIHWQQSDAHTNNRLHYFDVIIYQFANIFECAIWEWPPSHEFVPHLRRINANRVRQWYLNDICLWVCPTWTTSPHKHVTTTMRPIQ